MDSIVASMTSRSRCRDEKGIMFVLYAMNLCFRGDVRLVKKNTATTALRVRDCICGR